jgi:hypothetical protein
MFCILTTIVLTTLGADPPQVEPAHARNPVYLEVLGRGLESDGQTVSLPGPRLRDGQAPDAQRAALREVAGSDRALEELVRSSVTAPFVMKVRDLKAGDATVRLADLWFVVHADLAQLDPAREAARTDGKEVEAGNMRVRTRLLKAEELRATRIAPAADPSGRSTWFARIHARLLDRIELDVTNRVVATQSGESVVIAARTDPAFDKEGPEANGWQTVASSGGPGAQGTRRPYRGGISYARISRLAFRPGALLVEVHSAFVEPHEWFQGAPILRSKFGVIAQDQIRALRRALARGKEK